MTNFSQSYLRDRVLRFIFYFKFISKAIDKVFIILFSFFKFIFFIKRLRKRPRDYFNVNVFSSSCAIFNIYGVLYIIIPFNRIRFPLICFFYIFKSNSNSVNYFFCNILIVLSVSIIRVIRSV